MTRLAPLPLVLLAGCLYTGTRNEPPSVELSLTSGPIYLARQATVHAVPRDDQSDFQYLTQQLQFQLLDAQRNPVDACVATLARNGSDAEVVLYRPGSYFVEASTSDPLGAAGPTTMLQLDVADTPPSFSPAARALATTPVNSCQSFTAGQGIVIGFSGTVSDPDTDATPNASCPMTGEMLQYTWLVTASPKGAQPRLAPTVAGGCPEEPTDGGTTLVVADPKAQICLYTDASVATASSADYQVTLAVSDGVNPEVRVPSPAIVAVRSDQPPCILGGEPELGLRVVDRLATQSFQVVGVADDLDPFPSPQLTFLWSVWRQSDAVWRPVVDHPQSDYALDTSGFDVGERVDVRVEAVDRTGEQASCDPSVDQCLEMSCAVTPANSCMRWMTWSLELR